MTTRLFYTSAILSDGSPVVHEMAPEQGANGTIGLQINDTAYQEQTAFARQVDDTVNGTSFPTSVNIPVVDGNLEVRWRVQRRDGSASTATVLASSDYSPAVSTAGVNTATLTLDTTWNAGDWLWVTFEIRRAGGHGNVTADISVSDDNSFVDAPLAAAAETAEGGSVASVSVLSSAGGTKAGDGGAASTVSVLSTGGGNKAADGASDSTVTVTSTGGGQASTTETASGGSTDSVSVLPTGSGAKASDGGSNTAVSVSSTESGNKTASGGTGSAIAITSTGSGDKSTSNGSAPAVTVTSTGGGQAEQAGQGGSTASVGVSATGGGVKAADGGSSSNVIVVDFGAGTKQTDSGSDTQVNVTSTGGGTADEPPISGSSTASIQVTATGGGQAEVSEVISGGSRAAITTTAQGSGIKATSGGVHSSVIVVSFGAGSQIGGTRLNRKKRGKVLVETQGGRAQAESAQGGTEDITRRGSTEVLQTGT